LFVSAQHFAYLLVTSTRAWVSSINVDFQSNSVICRMNRRIFWSRSFRRARNVFCPRTSEHTPYLSVLCTC
jgi:hypothetical protein